MTLSTYRKKRDFRKTPEPAGATARKGRKASTLRFAVQKHDASRLHYDFRLEMEGVLRSWAVPKGPSLNPGERRLAVEVEDHPLEYGSFEGIIPQGEYGGGTVMLWDQGTWSTLDNADPGEAYRAGKLKFALKGRKLRGAWSLVRMHGGPPGSKANWLLIKDKDQFANTDPAADITITDPLSVTSGRDLPVIADAKSAVWTGGDATKAVTRARSRASTAVKPAPRPRASRGMGSTRTRSTGSAHDVPIPAGARSAPMPGSLAPQLCTLVEQVPPGPEWRHEVKFDGYRMLVFLDGSRARTITRAGLDWSAKFPELVRDLSLIKAGNTILDGELVSLDSKGLSHFQGLQASLKAGATGSLVYFVFDLPYLNGMDLRRCSLDERYKALSALVARWPSNLLSERVRLSERIDGSGARVMEQACRLHLEGIISKRADSVYEERRSGSWVKTKCGNRQEFVIAGYTEPRNSRAGFGALVLAYHNDSGALVHAGRVGTGFDDNLLRDLGAELRKLETGRSPLKTRLTGPAARGVHWVRPTMVAEVAFTQWTGDGLLRHPVFAGVRADKKASEVVREEPMPKPRGSVKTSTATRARSRTRSSPDEDSQVLGVAISHPERVVYPELQITKLAVAQYFEQVADAMMPYLADRPLSLVRCPSGAQGMCFYNKHLDTTDLSGLREMPIKESKGTRMYAVVTAPAGLASLAQMNTLELHAWGSRAGDIEHPDRLVFDLDPGENVKWTQLVQAARRTRKLLEDLGLGSFVKTTGGKGLHVVLPIRPTSGWDGVKSFCRQVAEYMQNTWPDEYIATMSKAKRRDKIFVDYLRNQRGATAIATFSTRARPNAGVSMPLTWDKLARSEPGAFTISSVPDLIGGRWRDPWRGFETLKQSLPRSTAPKA